MSYIIDVYKGKVEVQKNIFKLALYISFFPQLIAGPIVRYSEIVYDIDNRKENIQDIYYGVCRFIVGLSKKVLIADILAESVNSIFALSNSELTVALSWTGAVLYFLEIYFDFSGYSDMAIGMASIFGFHFNENFTMPYISQNVTEFWRRWHISLSSFLRDYVYIPLGGNRRGSKRTYLNLSVVFLLCGIWHGAAWTFILWGVYHGAFLVLERVLRDKWKFQMKGILGNIITMLVVMFGWILFNSGSFSDAISFIRAMFGMNPLAEHQFYKYQYYVNSKVIFVGVIGFIFSMVPFSEIKRKIAEAKYVKGICCFLLLIVCMIYMSDATFNSFIYFQF